MATPHEYNIDFEKHKATTEICNKILSIAIASTKIHSLVIERKNEQVMQRIPLHVCIHGEMGIGKSTSLRAISDMQKISINTSISKASLYGSIEMYSKEFVFPLLWLVRNNVFLFDEFIIPESKEYTHDLFLHLLSIIESQKYSKVMGIKLSGKAINEHDRFNKNLFCRVKKNVIEVKTNFSFIFTTMDNPYGCKSPHALAFFDRCISLHFNPTIEEQIAMTRGNNLFNLYPIDVKQDVFVKNEDLEFIIKFVVDKNLPSGYMRTVGDCLRIFAVLGFHDEQLYDYLCENKKYFLSRHFSRL